MPRVFGDLSDDDYVAQVLANEARDNSVKYTSEGLGAYMPKNAAPKPNTRFLRHIIRETDNHNAALKRKEEREARDRARLRHRTSGDGNRDRDRNPARGKERDDRDRHRSHRRHHRSRSESDEDRSRRHRRHERSSKRDRRRDRDERGLHRSYSHSRSRSPRESARDSHRRSRRRSRSRTPESRRKHTHEQNPSSAPSGNDSDPLEDLVGPLPRKDGHEPIRTRGRGAYKPSSSTIDAHFAKDYDPTLDVHPDDGDEVQSGGRPGRRRVQGLMTEDDDWELALEALRDRTRWKQKGEERLRQAGFDESTLERWRGNAAFAGGAGAGEEGRVEDVKWSRRGEGREWDRGKVFDDEGGVDVKAPW